LVKHLLDFKTKVKRQAKNNCRSGRVALRPLFSICIQNKFSFENFRSLRDFFLFATLIALPKIRLIENFVAASLRTKFSIKLHKISAESKRVKVQSVTNS